MCCGRASVTWHLPLRKGGFATRVVAELCAEADKLIGPGASGDLDFEALETAAWRLALKVMGKTLAARLNAERYDATDARSPCQCGGQARYAGRWRKTFVTVLSKVELQRAWYHRDACHRGSGTRDRDLGLRDSSLSPAVQRMAGLAGAETSFGRAGTMFRELSSL